MNPNHFVKAKKELHQQFPDHFDDHGQPPAGAEQQKKPVLSGFQAAVLLLLFFILLTIWVGVFIFWRVGAIDKALDVAISAAAPADPMPAAAPKLPNKIFLTKSGLTLGIWEMDTISYNSTPLEYRLSVQPYQKLFNITLMVYNTSDQPQQIYLDDIFIRDERNKTYQIDPGLVAQYGGQYITPIHPGETVYIPLAFPLPTGLNRIVFHYKLEGMLNITLPDPR